MPGTWNLSAVMLNGECTVPNPAAEAAATFSSLIPELSRKLIGELLHFRPQLVQGARRDAIRGAADPDGGDGMAAMIENGRGDAGEGLALFAAIEGVAVFAGLLQFGEEGGGAGDGVAGVFGELHLLHKGFLRLGAPVGEHGLRGGGGVQGEGMADLDDDLHRMRGRDLIEHDAVIASEGAEQRGLARGIAQSGEDGCGGLDEPLPAHGGMTEAEELAAGAVGLRAFIALGIAAERERGGDAEDGVLRHCKRLGHRSERQALGMPREQLQQVQGAVEDGHLVAAERVGGGFSGF